MYSVDTGRRSCRGVPIVRCWRCGLEHEALPSEVASRVFFGRGRVEKRVMLISRREPHQGVNGSNGSVYSDTLFQAYPAILEFLTVERWPDGKPRKPGTFSVFFQEGKMKCWINDKDADVSACLSAGSVLDLLGLVEAGLVSGSLDWRRSPQGGRRSR
jgi:hypothetical protein